MREALKKHIISGTDLMVHSSVKAFGEKIDIESFILALIDSLGSDGTLIMPTFSFNFKESKIFDPQNTPAETGLIPETFRKMEINGSKVERDLNPMQSIAAFGKRSKEYTASKCSTSFGPESAFDQFYERDGHILLAGVDYNKTTFYHYPEEKYKVPYRFWKTFPGSIKTTDQLKEVQYQFFARDLDYMPNINHYGLLMEERGLVKKFLVKNAIFRLFKAKDLYQILKREITRDPYSLVNTDRDLWEIKTTSENTI